MISSYTFRNCTSLGELNLPDSIITINSYAFYGCSGFRLLNLNDSLETIGAYAFYGCNGLVSLVLNDGLKTLSDHSFANCANLTTVSVPKSVTTVHSQCFANCPKIVLYCYSGSAAHQAAEQAGYNYVLLDEHEHQFEDTIETSASCTHEGSVIRTCSLCGYHYIVLTEPLGHDYQEIVLEPTCTEGGYTKHRCSRCDDEYKTDYTSPLGHAFGDWIQDTAPTPMKEGLKHKECSLCGETKSEVIPKAELNDDYGLVYFTIVNAQTLEPVYNAQLQIKLNDDETITAATDNNGKTSMVLPVGIHSVLVYKSGYLNRSVKFSVASGETILPQIGISDKPVYDATITSHLMSYDEIVEAGIDPSAAENNHIYKYELLLEFVPEIDWMSLFYYMGDAGEIFGGGGSYISSGGSGGSGGGRAVIWIDPLAGGSGTKGHFHIPATETEEEINIYPVGEYFYLIIRGEVRWLKEMFDVEMLVVNNSLTDTMENMTATLDLPEGLSLATMVSEQQTLTQNLGTIESGGHKSVHWYVRGDSAGSYSVSARLQGRLMPFDEEIDDLFIGDNAIQVWAGDALHLHFEFPNAAFYGEDYPIKITLENVSDITLYNISHKIQIVQGMEYYYADGTTYSKIETSEWFSSGKLREFHPGDKIIMEADVNIFFQSEKIAGQLQNMCDLVTGMEELMKAYKAVQAGLDAAKFLENVISGCAEAIDNFDFTLSTETAAKLELFRELHKNISSIYLAYSKFDNDFFDAAIRLANSGVGAAMNAICEDPDTWLREHSVDDIRDLLGKTKALGKSMMPEQKKFNIYDSIRTMISAIPVRFVLTNIIMTEDEDNTTSIPWSYTVTDAGVQYFGVSNVSKYLMSFMQVAMADMYDSSVPWYIKLLPGLDDPFNRGDAVGYIQAVENEIALVKAKDATGGVTFRCWVERSGHGTTGSSDYILECDNETAVVENGVLTFTGDGMIELTPVSGENGTLHIEDSEGNRYEYEVNVVPQHECHAGSFEIIVEPTEEYEGFGVRCCETCGEIMDIETLTIDDLCSEHTFTEWIVDTEPDDESDGMLVRTCTVCGKKEYDFFSSGAEHTHMVSTWTTVKEPTCINEGERRGLCDFCGEKVTESIEKTDHTPGVSIRENYIEPTYDAEGSYDEVVYCSVCGEELSRNTVILDKLTPTTIVSDMVLITDENYVYNGSSIEPEIVINFNGDILTEGTDYTISFDNNINAGTAAAVITGTGAYTGTVIKNFTIAKKEITPEVTITESEVTYDGTVKTPEVIVKDRETVLANDKDYTVTYSEGRINAGTYEVSVELKGNYAGSGTASFTIVPKAITPEVTFAENEFIYDGTQKTPEVIVKDGETVLAEDTDYTVAYDEGRIDAGTYNVSIELKGNYAGNKSVSFTIVPKEVTPAVIITEEEIIYDGTQKTPGVIVKDGETILAKDKDYTVAYDEGRVNAGIYNVSIELKGNYSGRGTAYFTIIPKAITPTITLTPTSYTYDGSVKTPDVTVKDGDVTLEESTDYKVAYAPGRTNAGTYNVKVTLQGNYSGSKKVSFRINPESVTPEVILDKTSYVYDGEDKIPAVTVKAGDKALTEDTDYEIDYPDGMINAGTYTITVKLKGNYTGSGTASYTITKAAQKVTAKVSASSIAVGKTASVTVTGAQGKVTYTSADASIASIDTSGTITGKKVGTVKISIVSAATANYKKKTVTVTIKIVPGATTKIAAASKAGGIKLAWKKVTGAAGYYIYRNDKLAKTITSGSTTSWGDTKATGNCTKYTYKIVAYADTGKSTLSKSLTTYFITRPAISSLTNSIAGKLTVKWGKNAKATGYQVQYSTSSSFTSYKTVTITKNTTISKIIASLTKGKTYYVRVRSYLKADGKNYYSMWSVVKKLKLTK